MPCHPIHDDQGRQVGIACTRGPRVKACFYCGRPSTSLCDWPLGGKTCDKPMCVGCRNHHPELGDVDYCRTHEAMHKDKINGKSEVPSHEGL